MAHKVNVGLVALLAALAAAAVANASVDRRASMGFMGMRGKKDGDGGLGDDGTSAAAAVELDKRTLVFRRPLFGGGGGLGGGGGGGSAEGFKRAMGFVGMRGKKEYYKGSAAGFFGVRGKKVPSGDAFFGMRGKKWPVQQQLQQPAVMVQRRPNGDADVEQAVFDLHRIIEDLRSERERNFLAAKFDEDREIR